MELSGEEADLNSVLTRVSRQVALVRQSNVPSDPGLHHKRQIPLKQDTLIRYDLKIIILLSALKHVYYISMRRYVYNIHILGKYILGKYI